MAFLAREPHSPLYLQHCHVFRTNTADQVLKFSFICHILIYFISFDTLKRAFVGVHKVIQANDKSECEQVSSKMRQIKQIKIIAHICCKFYLSLKLLRISRVLSRKFWDLPTEFNQVIKLVGHKVVIWCKTLHIGVLFRIINVIFYVIPFSFSRVDRINIIHIN